MRIYLYETSCLSVILLEFLVVLLVKVPSLVLSDYTAFDNALGDELASFVVFKFDYSLSLQHFIHNVCYSS